MRSLRGTIGGERKGVKRDALGAKARLLLRGALADGEALSFGTTGRPIVRRKRDAPEARRRLIKFDADAALVVDAFADVDNLARDFFSRFHIAEAQVVSDGDQLFHQDEPAMRIHDLCDGFFGKRSAGRKVPTYDDVNSEKNALAAADGVGFGSSGLGRLGGFHGETSRKLYRRSQQRL